jgi:NlpC/P60 family
MTAQIRLLLLVLVVAYSVAFGPGQAQPATAKRAQEHRLRVSSPRLRARRAPRTHQDSGALGVRAVRFARKLVGIPYRWGGDSPLTGFDCSGFVRFVYQRFGITLPHSSYGDFDLGIRVPRAALRPGDLVFFDGVGHVGMYIGNGRFIHAPHSGTEVQVTSMSDPWYRSRYDGARRLISGPARRAALVRRAALRVTPKAGLNTLGSGLDKTWFDASYNTVRRAVATSAARVSARAFAKSG